MKLAFLAALHLGAAVPVHDQHLYDADCCNTADCRPATPGEVIVEGRHGWTVNGRPAATVRPSRDGRFHVCPYASGGSFRCVYVPLSG